MVAAWQQLFARPRALPLVAADGCRPFRQLKHPCQGRRSSHPSACIFTHRPRGATLRTKAIAARRADRPPPTLPSWSAIGPCGSRSSGVGGIRHAEPVARCPFGMGASRSSSCLAIATTLTGISTAGAQTSIGFSKSALKNETSAFPTSLQFGPDGRLYVAQFNGQIKVYTVARSGTGQLHGHRDTDDHVGAEHPEPQRQRRRLVRREPARHRPARRGHGAEPRDLRDVERPADRWRSRRGGPEPRHELRDHLAADLERLELGEARPRAGPASIGGEPHGERHGARFRGRTRCTWRRAGTRTRARPRTTSRGSPSSRCRRRSCRSTSRRSATAHTTCRR